MIEMLPQVLAELHLQPGQSRRIQVNGYVLEIRRPVQAEPEFAHLAMLEPWVEFPRTAGTPIAVSPGKLPLPDAPDIPGDFEENEP